MSLLNINACFPRYLMPYTVETSGSYIDQTGSMDTYKISLTRLMRNEKRRPMIK